MTFPTRPAESRGALERAHVHAMQRFAARVEGRDAIEFGRNAASPRVAWGRAYGLPARCQTLGASARLDGM